MLEKIRDLKVKTLNGIIDAVYIKDTDSGIIYYQEKGHEMTDYPGHKYCCADCKYCDRDPKTDNEIYQVKPLPAHTRKCDLINLKYKDFDITFKADWANCKHPVCNHFEPRSNLQPWNINQFIDIKNSCVHRDLSMIQSFAYKGEQVPFTFYMEQAKWEKLDFIEIVDGHPCIRVFNPIFWDSYRYHGETYTGANHYIEIYNITDKAIQKEIKAAFHSNCVEAQRFSGRLFDLATMWFI